MATISSRQAFKDYCLRRLGFPVITINVDDDQVEDRIDDALQYFIDRHADGTQKIFVSTVANGEAFNVLIPGEGIVFQSNVVATLNNTSITVFYG